MTKEEIRKAAEELEARTDGKRTESVDESWLQQQLTKALDHLLQRDKDEETLAKSEKVKEENTEELTTAEKAGEEEFFNNLTKSETVTGEMIDASPVLEGFTDQIAKAMGAYAEIKKAQADTHERLGEIEEALVPVIKSMEAILQIMNEVRDQPVTKTAPGFFGIPRESAAAGDGQVPGDLRERVLKAVQSKNLNPRFYSLFDTRTPEEIWSMLPEGALD